MCSEQSTVWQLFTHTLSVFQSVCLKYVLYLHVLRDRWGTIGLLQRPVLHLHRYMIWHDMHGVAASDASTFDARDSTGGCMNTVATHVHGRCGSITPRKLEARCFESYPFLYLISSLLVLASTSSWLQCFMLGKQLMFYLYSRRCLHAAGMSACTEEQLCSAKVMTAIQKHWSACQQCRYYSYIPFDPPLDGKCRAVTKRKMGSLLVNK